MTSLFRSKSCGTVGLIEFNSPPPSPFFHRNYGEEEEEEGEEEEGEEEEKPFEGKLGKNNGVYEDLRSKAIVRKQGRDSQGNQSPVLDVFMAALRKSLVTCSVENDDVSSLDIGSPTNVKHISHVTFDRFNGYLGLPSDLLREVPRRAPSASAKVFGVSAESMQCSFDDRGNSVPTILLKMQKRLYTEGGLKAEGVFRINPDNGQEERVRSELNRGVVPSDVDVHCLAGLIKAWFRELPVGVLDSLAPEQVMYCNTEDDCSRLVELLPPTEAALLDWAINLMADVVHHEQINKMNAHNIAMVFAPNMTKMADPLTALIHAVQVMNLLKTLILKTLHDRPLLSSSVSISQTSKSPSTESKIDRFFELYSDGFAGEGRATATRLRQRSDFNVKRRLRSFRERRAREDREFNSIHSMKWVV